MAWPSGQNKTFFCVAVLYTITFLEKLEFAKSIIHSKTVEEIIKKSNFINFTFRYIVVFNTSISFFLC